MRSFIQKHEKKFTSGVYVGAAILIGITGFRIVVKTNPEWQQEYSGLLEILPYFTMASLVLEVILLVMYSLTIYFSDTGTGKQSMDQPLFYFPTSPDNEQLKHYTETLEGIQSSMSKTQASFSEMQAELKQLLDANHEAKIQQQIQQILQDMMTSSKRISVS